MAKKLEHPLKDRDIRTSLINHLSNLFLNDPDTLILGEFGICEGNARIDMAVVNGRLIGYEIKSEADTLERLPYQQKLYSEVFDRVIIIVGKNHSQIITDLIPSWWGIWLAGYSDNGIEFTVIREGNENQDVNPFSLAQCLWRDEAMDILKINSLDEGLNKARRSILWKKLSKVITCEELKEYVRCYLKSRTDWNIVLPRE